MNRDPHRALIIALADHLGPLDNLASKTRGWSSATFTGMRHDLAFTIAARDPVGRLTAALGEAELPMTGHFVADLTVVSANQEGDMLRVKLEALTIEDA